MFFILRIFIAEAAVLGTPSIRFNDFVGKLSYLRELEDLYGLTIGIKTTEPQKLYQTIRDLLDMPNLKQQWKNRRQVMLVENVNVTDCIVSIIEKFGEQKLREINS